MLKFGNGDGQLVKNERLPVAFHSLVRLKIFSQRLSIAVRRHAIKEEIHGVITIKEYIKKRE
jgi:hypothetical protein